MVCGRKQGIGRAGFRRLATRSGSNGAANLNNTNDLPAGTVFSALVFTGSGYTIDGNAIGVSGGVTAGSNRMNMPVQLTASQTVSGGRFYGAVSLDADVTMQSNPVFNGAVDVGAHALIVNDSDVSFVGPVSGSGTIGPAPSYNNPYANLTFSGPHPFSGAITSSITNSPFQRLYANLNGASLPNATFSGRDLNGNGTIGGAVTVLARLSRSGSGGFNTGNLTLGDVSFGQALVIFSISGPVAGTNYFPINVTGTVTLANARLAASLSSSFVPTRGEIYTIISNDGAGAVSGTFSGMPEGSVILLNSVYQFQLSYVGGDGNDVTLAALNGKEPSSASILSSANPSTPGQSVTFTATVTGSGGTPSGTVTFKDGTTTLGTGALSGGSATYATTSLALGPHSITAVYPGDSTFGGSTSPVLTQTVDIAPNAPTIGTATAGNAQVSVAFTPPASNGGSAITSYTATCGGQIASGAVSPITVGGLTNGTPYTCTVTATNGIGTSGPSAASNSVTPATVPDAPTIGTATGGNAQITVAFTPPASNGGSAITSYTATCGAQSSSGAGAPIVVGILTNGTPYTCTVTATNGIGTGPASAPSNSVTPQALAVTYDANGATGGTVPVDGNTYATGATVTVLANTGGLTRTSYNFAGWNTQANGGGIDYAASGSATFTIGSANVKLYAKWTLAYANVTVTSLVRAVSSPTMADSVTYSATFSAPVSGVGVGNFTLAQPALDGAGVRGVSGSGTTWTVAVATGRGTGALQLNLDNVTGIIDGASSLPLAATSASGEVYAIDKGGTVHGTGDGQPDASFGTGGYALFSLAQGVASPGALVVLPNGRILAAGGVGCNGATGTQCTLQLAQYLDTGAPDPAFGVNGQVSTAITGVNAELAAWHIVNADATISLFVAGSRLDGPNTVPFVAKFNADGTPAAAFGSGGVATVVTLPLASPIVGAAPDGSGRPLLAGTKPPVAQGTDVAIARLTLAGVLDGTFGSGGIATVNVSTTGSRDDAGSGVVVQPNGRIVVGGRTQAAGGADFMVLRRNGNNTDNGFGTSGVATAHFAASTGDNAGRRVALQSDGKIVIVGGVQVGSDTQCGVARFMPDGTPDATFDADGQTLIPLAQGCLDVTLQLDGKIAVSAQDRDADVTYATVARLLANGAIDPDFGTDGVLDISSYGPATRVAVTTAGKLLTGVVLQDPDDGIRKSYVVQLGSQLALPTTTTITSITPSPALTGQPYTVSVTVTAASGTPTGTVDVSDGAGAGCTLTLAGGSGSCALASTTKGGKTITASYGGSGDHRASVGTLAQTINPANTATAISADAVTVQVGTPVTLTATVTATSAGATTPFGNVTFKDGGTALGTASLNGVGVATKVVTLPAGTYNNITANFVGDADYFTNSKSPPLSLAVQALPTLKFSRSSEKVSQAVGAVTLTVQRAGSTLGPVAVSYATADGTAIAGTDYTAVGGPLNWAAGDATSRTISVPIINRGGNLADRKFTVNLSAPTGATLTNPSTVTITIHN